MVAMVDDHIGIRYSSDAKTQYLLQLLATDPIEASLYSDAGPPVGATRAINLDTRAEAHMGWVEVAPGKEPRLRRVAWFKAGKPVESIVTIERNAYDRVVRSTLPPDFFWAGDPDAIRRNDGLAMLAAETIQADMFVTDRSLPFALGRDEWSSVTLMHPHDALPIVGLYMRRQRRFVLVHSPALGQQAPSPSEHFRDQNEFYWEAAGLVLIDSWRWRTACDVYARGTGDKYLSLLRIAVAHRMSQVLRARDDLLATAAVTQDMDTAEDILNSLDAIFIFLMAAFDSLARICHQVLKIEGSDRSAGWQKSGWTKKIVATVSALAPQFNEDGFGTALMTLLSRLRNNIHGEALSATGLVPFVGDHALESFMALPHTDPDKILTAIERLGGQEAWGIRTPLVEFGLRIHPATMCERVIAQSIHLMNQIMIAVPVETLDGIDRPANLATGGVMPLSLSSQRLVWQLGLSSPIVSA